MQIFFKGWVLVLTSDLKGENFLNFNGPNLASFCFYFCPFPNTLTNKAQNVTINGKIVDGVLGI